MTGPGPSLSFRRFSCPLGEPLRTANGPIEYREGFLVRIDDGETVGLGEATPLPGWTESIDDCEAALERATEAFTEDGDPAAAVEAVDRSSAARHGVSLALADLRATRDSIPLYEHLGCGERVARVPANATIGDGPPSETADAVTAAIADGFGTCKVKVGLRPVEEDVARIHRARQAAGPDVELRVDANGAWTTADAEAAIPAFEAADVSVLEQPLPAGALEGHAALRSQTSIDVALDEGLLEHGVDAIQSAEAADAVVLKPMALGGLDVAMQVATWLGESEVYPIVTTTIDAVVARTGAVHLAAALPDPVAGGLATGHLLETDLGPDPVPFERGAAVVPQAKGLGVGDLWGETR